MKGRMILQSHNIDDYLGASVVIDWHDANIRKKTGEVVGGTNDDVEKARKLFEWVRDTIPHSRDINSEVVTCKASEVLAFGTGICYAKSHLLAAMCRCVGIPAGFCYQVYRVPPGPPLTAIHGFNALYLVPLPSIPFP